MEMIEKVNEHSRTAKEQYRQLLEQRQHEERLTRQMNRAEKEQQAKKERCSSLVGILYRFGVFMMLFVSVSYAIGYLDFNRTAGDLFLFAICLVFGIQLGAWHQHRYGKDGVWSARIK